MNIAAVIVTFNRKDMLIKVLDAVLENDVAQVYVIDNNSTDGTEEYLKQYISSNEKNKIVYKKLTENTGGAGGFHEGVKLAHNAKIHDWLWLMDDDICPRKDTLEHYKATISENSEIGAVMGVRMYNDIPFFFETKTNDFVNYRVKNEKITIKDSTKKHFEIANFPFEGPMIKAELIDEIGYPNSDFFIRGDDTDYAIKIKKISRIHMVTDAKFDKLISPYQTSNEGYDFTWKNYYAIRNVIYLNREYGTTLRAKYIRNIRILFANIYKNTHKFIDRPNMKNFKTNKYIWLAFYHGITGKLGKTYVPGDF